MPSSTAIWRPAASAGPAWGPFSITGQPNAMGGREVGGLANQLAAHMEFDDPENVERVAPLLEHAAAWPARRG